MKTLSREDLKKHLVGDLGIQGDDIVFLFSAMWGLGRLEEGFETITNAFKDILTDGMMILPTFSYSWAKKEAYDPELTDCPDMGNYPNYAYKLPEFVRTKDPNFSVAFLKTPQNSKEVDELIQVGMNCFGEDSIFAKLHKLTSQGKRKVKIILLGGAFNDCLFRCTFFHLIQQRHQISYRYLKEFFDPTGVIKEPLKQFSRYLDYDEYKKIHPDREPEFTFPAVENFSTFGEVAKSEGILKTQDLNYYPTRMMELSDLYNLFERQIIEDPLCYLEKNKLEDQ